MQGSVSSLWMRPHGWWHYDPITKVAWWDDCYKEIFGVTGHQSPNVEILARIQPDDLPGVWAKVEAD